MTKKEEEIEKLDKEIKQKQDKLSGIITAINHEDLELANKKLEVKDISATLGKLSKQLIEIESEYDTKKEEFNTLEKTSSFTLKGLNNNIATASSELRLINEKITENNSKYEEMKIEHENIIKKENDTYLASTETHLNEINKLNRVIKDKENLASSMTTSYESKIKSYNIKIDNLNNDIDLKNGIISNLAVELNKLEIKKSRYEDEILNLDKKIDTKNNDILNLDKKIDELKNIKSTTEEELAIISKEKKDFIQAKLLLQKDREALQFKENLIKEKYELAGITY